MKKMYLTLLFILSIGMTSSVFAEVLFSYDFSSIKIDASKDVDWNFYNQWYVGYKEKVDTAKYAVWNGKPISKARYVYNNRAGGNSVQVLAIGLTNDGGKTFIPIPTPPTCLVTFKNDYKHILFITGTIHVPGNYKQPYIENLYCKLY